MSTKIHEWAIDIDFSDWRKKDDNELFVPMVAWLLVHKSTQAKDDIGVFAARNFEKGEVIGLFSGCIPTKEPSRYAITTKNHDSFDPLRGFADSGSLPKHTMAMHHIIQVKEISLVNASIDQNNLLVQAIKDIAIGEEIFVALKSGKQQTKEDTPGTIYMKKRRKQDEEKLINGFLTNDALLIYATKKLLANKTTSFSAYFDLNKYVESVEADHHDEFKNKLGKLREIINAQVYYAQKGWILNTSRDSHKKKLFTRIDEWAIDIHFSNWIQDSVDESSVPMV